VSSSVGKSITSVMASATAPSAVTAAAAGREPPITAP
jgi:hypothetical protein